MDKELKESLLPVFGWDYDTASRKDETVQGLFKFWNCTNKSILRAYDKLYPSESGKPRKELPKLIAEFASKMRNCEAKKSDPKRRLDVTLVQPSFKGEDETPYYYDAHLRVEGDDMLYSLSFIDWDKVAAMKIAREATVYLSPPALAAHIAWECTFYGSEAAMKKKGNALLKRAKESKKK